MGDRGWYAESINCLSTQRQVTLIIGGSAACAIRRDLTTVGLGESTQRAGWSTLWHMVRYRLFYRLVSYATAFGLGISLEDAPDGKLVVHMNGAVGRDGPRQGELVIQKGHGSQTAS
jgi:hypothetical protein